MAVHRRQAAVSRHDVGGANHARGWAPEGAGSESGAAVPSGACHDCGATSRSRFGHQWMCRGVISIQMRAKYHPIRRRTNRGCPFRASGYFRVLAAMYRSVLAWRSESRTVARPWTRTVAGRSTPDADRVGEEQAHPGIASGPFRFGRIGQPRRDVEGPPPGADVRSGGHGDGRRCPGEAGVLSRDRALPDLDQPRRPRAGPGGGGAGRWVVHVGKNTGASPVITRRRGTGDGTVTR